MDELSSSTKPNLCHRAKIADLADGVVVVAAADEAIGDEEDLTDGTTEADETGKTNLRRKFENHPGNRVVLV
jgi:hypothetical protein